MNIRLQAIKRLVIISHEMNQQIKVYYRKVLLKNIIFDLFTKIVI
jgi:hypothetical protein